MSRTILLLAASPWLAPAVCPADDPPDSWILVVAPAFREALEPLCELRKGQGLRVEVVQTTDVLAAEEIRGGDGRKLAERVRKLRAAGGKCYVLLVGAAEVPWHLPADKLVVPSLDGTVGRMKGSPTDHGYAPADADCAATAAVGRFPARSADEARQFVRKTLDFEQDRRPGVWRRRATILAGNPEFNPFVDSLVEKVALARLDRLDPSWSGRAIFHNSQSRFCLPDDALHDRARKYVEEGQALTLYLGHSGPEGFWAGRAKYLDRDDWANLKIPRGAGVFATFGCYGCKSAGGEAYGVAALRNPGGPVAVLGSRGVCYAAMVQLAADGLFESALAGPPPERLGDSWLRLQRNLAAGPIAPLAYRILDAVDGDPNVPQATQRREHLEMFALLGDPALRWPAPAERMAMTVEGEAPAGATLTVRGTSPERLAGVSVRVTVERPPGGATPGLVPLPDGPPAARAAAMLANHDRANDYVLASREVRAADGRFEAKFVLPRELPYSRLTLRAYASTERDEAAGATAVDVKK